MSLVIIFVIFLILGQIGTPKDYMTALLAWSLLIWFSLSVSLIIGPLSEKSELVEKIWHPAMYFMMPLSGVMFNVESLPIFAQKLLLTNPIVHCVELFREGFYGIAYKWHYDILYVVSVNIFMTLIGLIITSIMSKKIIVES
jgi:ABC-type polysaccharide/polyol phosphate export permease